MMYSSLLDAGVAGGGQEMIITQLVVMFGMFGILYFFMIRPQRKRDKEVQEMRAKLEVGDEIVTRGGIVGRIVSLKEDTVLIETGSDRTKLRVAKWAVEANTSNVTPAK